MNPSDPQRPIVIAGGSGFLGTSLATHLLQLGRRVIVLSRNPSRATGAEYVSWDARTLGDWKHVLNGAAAVVNLVGRTVDCIKTPDHKDEILRSRVESTLVLGQAMWAVSEPPLVWVQMATAHIYGDPPEVVCSEDSPFGIGLAPFVAKAWEEAFHASVLPEQRKVIMRTSFVIGRDRGAGGGALSRLKTLVRFGVGGTVGTGRQGMSWIHEADMNRLFEAAITDERMHGAYIASSPNPVSQKQFMKELRQAMRMPIGLPAFEWMVRIGAPLFMRTDPELALYGRYVVSHRLAAEGFQFQFPNLREAMADLLGNKSANALPVLISP
jgi:uncharacterized protein (TIGR01777 family)